NDTAEKIMELTNGGGVHVVLDFVGASATLALGIKVIRILGSLTMIGLARGSIPFSFDTVPKECSLATIVGSNNSDLYEVVALAEEGLFKLHTQSFALDSALDAYSLMKANKLSARAVIHPN